MGATRNPLPQKRFSLYEAFIGVTLNLPNVPTDSEVLRNDHTTNESPLEVYFYFSQSSGVT